MHFYYEKTVVHLVQLMADRLLNFYKPAEAEDSSFHETRWVKSLRKSIKALSYMEKAKTNHPKIMSTGTLQQLSTHLKMLFVSSLIF